MSAALRIAMWSGPRNLSTALLRSFGNRTDCFVTDEPLYAHYLKVTGLAHPGAEEVIATHDSDWQSVVRGLTGPIPEGKSVWYQKHMTHHLLAMIERDWLAQLSHCFLLRDPREVLPSLDAKFAKPSLADTGMAQQWEIFEFVRAKTGRVPPVIDSAELLRNPRGILEALCAALDLPFEEGMLHWPTGKRATDGVWAKHWYHNVEKSSGFGVERASTPELDEHLAALHEQCRPIYERLHALRLRA
jgi:hypothetical protein